MLKSALNHMRCSARAYQRGLKWALFDVEFSLHAAAMFGHRLHMYSRNPALADVTFSVTHLMIWCYINVL